MPRPPPIQPFDVCDENRFASDDNLEETGMMKFKHA